MKILIIGAQGMAGHMIKDYFVYKNEGTVYFTHRDPNAKEGISLNCLEDFEVERVIRDLKPDFIINCVGILNRDADIHPYDAIKINSLFPHQLARLSNEYGGKLVHISTDCVFSGTRGLYTEQDLPDSTTTYGKTKSLGEVTYGRHLTVRTSIIGPELKPGIGLFQWFMNQENDIDGYDRVYWNGVTSLELAKNIDLFISKDLSGLLHLTSKQPVSKYQLLNEIKSTFNKSIIIHRNTDVEQDRTLLNTRIDNPSTPKTTIQMIKELKQWMDEH